MYTQDGLEMSQFWSYTQNGLEMSQMVLKEVTCGWKFSLGPWLWPATVVCRVPMVMSQLRELKVHV